MSRVPQARIATWLVWAFLLGAVAGGLGGPRVEVLRPLADLFVWLLRALALPIVAASMLMASASIAPAQLGRLGGWSVAAYVSASALATLIGAVIGSLVPVTAAPSLVPGAFSTVPQWTALLARWLPGADAWSVDLLILPVLVIAAVAGLLLPRRDDGAPPAVVRHASTFVRLLLWPVWWYAPVGVFALTALTFARPGVAAGPLAVALLTVYVAQALVFAGLLAALWVGRVPAWRFVADVREVLVTALATGSSAAVLPLELRVATERAGIRASTAAVTVPLGVSISKVGTAAYLGALAVWAGQVTGTPLSALASFQLIAVTMAAAIATPPISGGGLIMLGLVFQQAGLPLGLVGVIGGLPLLGKGNTPLNALGRLVCARLIDPRVAPLAVRHATLGP
ncbi:MAG: cation:dicarboxylase symporter family transporter [Vicinamibacterales bacterium]|nr:cation:dicarboxylase symporter family transporter [Vicinamibacterales bacterium]